MELKVAVSNPQIIPDKIHAPASAIQAIRSGLIGCGEVARRYAGVLAREEARWLRLVSATDAARSVGQLFAEAAGLPFASSIDSLLAEDLEVVCICTPNATHAEIAERCLEAGKHVLLEHPMATTLPAAERLRAAARKARRELFIVRQRRFLATVQMVRLALNLGLLGKIRTVHASICWNRRPAYFEEKAWRAERSSGGVVLNQASHFLDILLWLFGDPRTVEMQMGNIGHAIGGEDSARGTIHFQTVSATFECTTAAPAGWNKAHLNIEGDLHRIELGGSGWEKFTAPVPKEMAALEPLLELPVNGDHAGYFERVARRLAGEMIEVVDANEGIRAVRLIDDLYADAATGQVDLAAHFARVFQER